MSSFNETQLLKHVAKNPEALVRHNQRFMSRVYPKSTRVQSR